jgi:hypothetical protein
MLDPISELVQAFESNGKPPLTWVVRWSESDTEPVLAAWRRSWTPDDMIRLRELAAHPMRADARRVAIAPILWATTDADRVRCEAIRRCVPTPPTLNELMSLPRWRILAFVAKPALSASTGLPS